MTPMPWSVRTSIRALVFLRKSTCVRRLRTLIVPFVVVVMTASGEWKTAAAQAKTSTTTTIAVTSGGHEVTTVTSGSVITLTASVNAGATALTTGQVNFCDATAKYCTDIHLLGTAQLTSAGTAVLRFRPGIGSHSYMAVFPGTKRAATSASGKSELAVTGTIGLFASTTAIAESGSWGNYALTGTVTEIGGATAPKGTVAFLDANNGNAVLGSGALGTAIPGLGWLNSQASLTSPSLYRGAVADLNRDGIPDLAFISYDGAVTILLGKGDGSFTTMAATPATGAGPTAIAVGDFNSDGIPDLAVVVNYSNVVTILLGHGDGTFTATASSPATAPSPNGITTGDFNGDGIADLAVASGNTIEPGSVTILLGNGDGTFTATAQSPSAGPEANVIVAGDFNGDSKTDLAVTAQLDDNLTILLGNGDGTFMPAASPQVTSYAQAMAMDDFNGDGKPDLIVTCTNGGAEIVLLGNGDGTFTTAPAFPVPAGIDPIAVVTADSNGDDVPDVAILDNSYTTGGVKVFLGNGDGTFLQSPTQPVPMSSPAVLTSGDFNGDGRTDLVVESNYINEALSVFLTEPTETATAAANVSITVAGQHMVDASYGGDGQYNSSVSGTVPLWGVPPLTATTLTLTSGGSAVTSVAPGTPVNLKATVKTGAVPVTSGQVKFCDTSASYCTDIYLLGTVALTNNGTATFRFIPGTGAHTYKAVYVESGYGMSSSSNVATLTVGPAPSPVYTDTTAITDGGFLGNYSLTATVVGYGGSASPTGNISFLDTSFGNIKLGTAPLGASQAGLGWLISQTPATGDTPVSEVAGDFNGDGIPDLAVIWNSSIYGGPYSITVLFGKGDGTFLTGPTTQATPVQLYPQMIAGDFNGDGKTDLAVLSSSRDISASYVTALLGNGNGTFATQQTSQVYNPGPSGGDFIQGSMVAADFHGDGKLDLGVVGNYVGSGGVIALLGKGDGTFKAIGTNSAANQGFNLIATGDFNGDGIPDLVATVYFDPGGAFIFLGKGDGTFAMATSFTVDRFASSIVVGDFNKDGVADLAFGYDGAVEVFLGNGDGTFKQAGGSPVSGAGLNLTLGDFNHDGKLDLAGIDNYNDQIDLFLGAGDGTFREVTTTPNISEDFLGPFALVAADFNEDGVSDLAMLTKNVATASILLTEPTQTATATVTGIAPVGAGTHNVEASYPGDDNYSPSVSGTIALTASLTPVVISPTSGMYSSVLAATMSESIPGSTIYYSVSGPVNTRGFLPYTGPISLTLGGVETITAYATHTGYQSSDYTTATFTLNLPTAPTPVISPAGGSYPGSQTVTISEAAASATVYYTTDGTYPTLNSTAYTGPIKVSTSETVAAIATASGYSTSHTVSSQYLIDSAQSSFIYTIAGNGTNGYSGDGGQATLAALNSPPGIVADKSGNLYIADSSNNVVRKVAAGTGIITTIAGNEIAGYSGDGGAATSATLNYPYALALDKDGNLYIADSSNYVVRKVAAGTGTIATIAGNGKFGNSGNGGPALSATLGYPEGIAIDGSGNLYITDTVNEWIRKVEAGTGTITTVAGNGSYGYTGDGGPAVNASFASATAVAVDSFGNLYIADLSNNVIRKVTASSGIISTIAGNGYEAGTGNGGYSGDGGPATSAELFHPSAVAMDSVGNLYIADSENQVIRKVTASNGVIGTVDGNGRGSFCRSLGGDGGPATSAALCYPFGVSVDGAGSVYIADTYNNRIRKATASAAPPTVSTAAPSFSVSSGTYGSPQTVTLRDTAPGAAIYVTMDGSSPSTLSQGYNGPISVSGTVTIKAIAVAPGYLPSTPVAAAYSIASPPNAVITTVGGNGAYGLSGVGGPATQAQIGYPNGTAFDGAGNFFFSDRGNNLVWMVAAKTGNLSVLAGNATAGYNGDGEPATNAQLNRPAGIAVDSGGNVYIADSNNNVVRKVTVATGLITTVAGRGGLTGPVGDGAAATAATLYNPSAVAFDKADNLYIADTNENRVRVVSASSGIITTFAGNGNYMSNGDGGPAASAGVEEPTALAFDKTGNLYIATPFVGRIRKVTTGTGIITTVAGNGNECSSGDGGPAISAEIDPNGLAVDAAGNVYFSNYQDTIREVATSTGVITRAAGNGYNGYSGDGGSATVAELDAPAGISFDASGNLFIADSNNSRIRKVTFSGAADTPIFSVPEGIYTSAQTVGITDTTPGATIYYTTDGTPPTTSSSIYSKPITVSETETLGAVAVATGYTQSAVTTAVYTINLPVTPSVTLTPSSSSITTAQGMTVTVAVNAGSGKATPTGTVVLKSGSFSAQQTLSSGSTTFNLPAGTLPTGSNTLTATYTPDTSSSDIYTAATQSVTVTVTSIGTATATISVTPSARAITNEQTVSVTVSVSGGSGQPIPTGSVTLANGAYYVAQELTSGATTFTIPAGTLGAGANTLTVNYSGDATYGIATGSTVVTVSQIVISAQAPPAVPPGGNVTTTLTFLAGSTYSGTMSLACKLTASPSGAQTLPTCSLSPASITITPGGNGTSTVTIQTTAGSGVAFLQPFDQEIRWLGGGGSALAAVLLFGIPAKRRRRTAGFALLLIVAAIGAFGCGGGSSQASSPPSGPPATTAGSYTFTVIATDATDANITSSATVTVTVQ